MIEHVLNCNIFSDPVVSTRIWPLLGINAEAFTTLHALHLNADKVVVKGVLAGAEGKPAKSGKVVIHFENDEARALYVRGVKIIEAARAALGETNTRQFVDTVILQLLQNNTNIEYEVVPLLTREMIASQDLDVVEISALYPLQILRQEHTGFRCLDEMMVRHFFEEGIGAEEDKFYLRHFPVVVVGNMIAFNQHLPVPTLASDNVRFEKENQPVRTGAIQWVANGLSRCVKGRNNTWVGFGADGKKYNLSVAGADVVE